MEEFIEQLLDGVIDTVAALHDQLYELLCVFDVRAGRDAEHGDDVKAVLHAMRVGGSEAFHRDEMGQPCDGCKHGGSNFAFKGVAHRFLFDAAVVEEQVDIQLVMVTVVVGVQQCAGRDVSQRGQATRPTVVELNRHVVAGGDEMPRRGFCFVVGLDGDGEVKVAREARFRPDTDRQAAYEREAEIQLTKERDD